MTRFSGRTFWRLVGQRRMRVGDMQRLPAKRGLVVGREVDAVIKAAD